VSQASATLETVFRLEYGRVLATLIRHVGDIDLAEDSLSDAMTAALTAWESTIPENPGAWLTTTARRKAIDRLRRAANYTSKQDELAHLRRLEQGEDSPEEQDHAIVDDQLRLIFTCCHPSLSSEAQVALTLKTLGGLSTQEIGRAFLIPETTMAQRIVRAKKKIKTANIPYRVPAESELTSRLSAVLQVIYLIFNEGYLSAAGDHHLRRDLCSEALRLGTLLTSLMPTETEAAGLAALMSFHLARFDARTDEDGRAVLLEDQDRSLWDQEAIAEADRRLTHTLESGGNGPYVLQAAIAGVHATSPSFDQTGWEEIAFLYTQLHALQPSPVIALNKAIAIALSVSPQAGLDEAELLGKALDQYPHFHTARAKLLERVGRLEEAERAMRVALTLTLNPADRAHLKAELKRMGGP
jgi:RNA polymerase sigma-70 factor (ECF subfamily)